MKISACMIVKNEEELLPQCLNSLVDIIDELCIVDTGSTDGTSEIIKAFESLNRKKIVVKQEKSIWEETNFSKHRNISLNLATGDLILIIDADEKLNFDISKDKFKEIINKIYENQEIKIISVTLRDWNKDINVMSCANTRIFKKGVSYRGKIHNTAYYEDVPTEKLKAGFISGVYIDHYGYDLSPEKMEKKFQRTSKALLEELESDNPRSNVEFYLCQTYGTNKQSDKSYEWGKKYLDKKLSEQEINPTIYFTMARLCIEKDKIQEAWEYVNSGLKLDDKDVDLLVVKSDLLFKEKRFFEMAEISRKYLITFQHLMNGGLTGKFYFTLRQDVLGCMLERTSIGYLTESLNAATAMILNPLTPKEILKDYQDNLTTWGLSSLWEALNEKIAQNRKSAN